MLVALVHSLDRTAGNRLHTMRHIQCHETASAKYTSRVMDHRRPSHGDTSSGLQPLGGDNVNKQSNMEKSTVGSNPCLLFVHSLSAPSIPSQPAPRAGTGTARFARPRWPLQLRDAPSLSQGQNAAQFSNQSFRPNYEQSYYFGTAYNDYWVR
jgi:hypothetical protein